MQLLIFAHRGEAQHFLSEGEYNPISFAFDGLYRSSDSLLLITGEGLKNASEKTAAICGAFANEIEQIINLGVAGALTPELELGAIYNIRTSYAQEQFKSYSCPQREGQVDCVSSHQRLFEKEQAEQLSHFAPLVDRELWSIGSIATLFKVPFYSAKLISDRVGEEREVCQVVKEQAPEFSARLYSYYLENFTNIETDQTQQQAIEKDKRFYLTTSQTRKYQSLLTSLQQKLEKSESEVLDLLELDEICESLTRPKQRSNALLAQMHALLNPFQQRVKEKLEDLLKDYTTNNLHLKFDESFETDEFSLSTRVQGPEHLKEIIQQLNELPYSKIKSLLRGDLDV